MIAHNRSVQVVKIRSDCLSIVRHTVLCLSHEQHFTGWSASAWWGLKGGLNCFATAAGLKQRRICWKLGQVRYVIYPCVVFHPLDGPEALLAIRAGEASAEVKLAYVRAGCLPITQNRPADGALVVGRIETHSCAPVHLSSRNAKSHEGFVIHGP